MISRFMLVAMVTLALASFGARGAIAQAAGTPAAVPAEAFPSADAVIHSYSSDPQRLAALKILLDLLEFKTHPMTPAAVERSNDYRRAITRLDPPRSFDSRRYSETRKYTQDLNFRVGVIARFAPAYAPEAARKAGTAHAAAAARADDALFWTLLFAVCALALASPVLVVARGSQVESFLTPLLADASFALPPALQRVEVRYKSYIVNYDCGRITSQREFYDKQRPGGGLRGGWGGSMSETPSGTKTWSEGDGPVRVAPNRSVLIYTATDGRHEERKLGLYEYKCEPDAMTGMVSCGEDVLLLYDHATDKLVETSEVHWLHHLNGKTLWGLSNAISVVGLIAIGILMQPRTTMGGPVYSVVIAPWIFLMALVSAAWIRMLKSVVVRIRRREFRTRWTPGLEAFLRERRRGVRR